MADTLQLAKLTSNPFSLVPGRRVTVWAGYKELRQQLLDIVESCRSDRVGLSEFVVLHGEYGAGKSHALRYLEYWITEARRDEFNAAVVHLETLKVAPTMNFVAIYRKIIENLMPHIRETAEWLDMIIEDTVKKEKPSARRDDLDTAIDEKYRDPNITPSFPPLALLLKGIKENKADAIPLLSGAAPRSAKLDTYGLMRPIDTEYDAVKSLGAYVNLCTRGTSALSEGGVLARNKAFYFFLDEFETMQDFKPAEALGINHGLRDLINACPENCCFLLGMSGDVRLIFGTFTTAVMRRMSRNPIEIQPLEVDRAITFLKEVLKGYRSAPSDPDEYPFHEDALRKITEATQPRFAYELFRSCRRVLEKAVLANRLTPGGWIEAADAEEFL
ncbi:MAG: hypothetical protein DDT32_02238 [Syntrophomonadaceae bacterium]|nr:hypothetical protein [Bacillota bacterium]MBT9148464.1 hypothetical protein [Bacillota bacterium]